MNRIMTMAAVAFACLLTTACQTTASGSASPRSGIVSASVAVTSAPDGAPVGSPPEISGASSSSAAPESAAPVSSGAPASRAVPASSGAPAPGESTGDAAMTTGTSSTAAAGQKSMSGSGSRNTGGSAGNSGGSGGSGSSGGGGDGSGAHSDAPAIVSLKITCTFEADQGQYVASAHYEVANATGIAVSVDDPGAVGSFGSAKGAEGDFALPANGCYSDSGEQVYDFDTTGGSPEAHKEIKRVGTHQRGDRPAPAAPKITEASLACSKQDDGTYHLTLRWAITNATGLALSVDNPGGVGSFGTYEGTGGQVDLPSNACYSDAGSQEFDLQTVGGADPQATRVLNFNGGFSRRGSSGPTVTTTTSTTTTPPPPGG